MFVSGGRSDDSARRPRCARRVGRTAGPRPPSRPAGDRGLGGWCWPPATRPRRTGCAPPWAAPRPAHLCPRAIAVDPRMSAYSEASKAVFEVFEDTTPLVEACRSTRPSSTWAGCGACPVPRRDRHRLRSEVAGSRPAHHRRCGPHQFLAKVASGVAKPDGLLVVPPTVSWTSSTRCRSSALRRRPGHVGQAPQPGIVTVGEVPGSPKERWCRCSGVLGRRLHALAHNCDPRPVHVGRRRRSMGSRTPSAGAKVAATSSLARRPGRRVTRRCARRPGGRPSTPAPVWTSPGHPVDTVPGHAARGHPRRPGPAGGASP